MLEETDIVKKPIDFAQNADMQNLYQVVIHKKREKRDHRGKNEKEFDSDGEDGSKII